MKKLVAAVMMMLIIFTGCSNSSGEGETLDAVTPGQGGEMTIWSFTETGVQQVDTFKEYYNETYGITPDIETVVIPYDEYLSKLLPALKNGTGPDLMIMEIGHLTTFMDKGADYAEDLSQSPYNALEKVSDNIPYTIDMSTTEDGKLVGLTWQANPLAIFYRMDIAEQVGLTEQDVEAAFTSLEGVEDLCQNLADDGYYCMGSLDDAQFFFDSYKTSPVGEDGKLSQEYLDNVDEFITTAADWFEKGYIAPYEYESTEWINQIHVEDPAEAKIFSVYKAPWILNRYLMDGETEGSGTWGDWRVTTPPTPGFGGGTWLVMNKSSEHKNLAWEFIDYVSESDDFGQRWANTKVDYYSDYSRQEANHDLQNSTFLGGQNIYDVLSDSLDDVDTSGYSSPYDNMADKAVMSVLTEVVSGNIAPEDGVEAAKEDIYTAAPELQ